MTFYYPRWQLRTAFKYMWSKSLTENNIAPKHTAWTPPFFFDRWFYFYMALVCYALSAFLQCIAQGRLNLLALTQRTQMNTWIGLVFFNLRWIYSLHLSFSANLKLNLLRFGNFVNCPLTKNHMLHFRPYNLFLDATYRAARYLRNAVSCADVRHANLKPNRQSSWKNNFWDHLVNTSPVD